MLWVYVKWKNGNIEVFRIAAFAIEDNKLKFYDEHGEVYLFLGDAKRIDFAHVFTTEMAGQFLNAVLHEWLEEHQNG